MNIVTISRILEITEKRSRFQRIKEISSNWKAVCVVSIAALTLKIAAEQIIMIMVR
jgi:hypothetical protein